MLKTRNRLVNFRLTQDEYDKIQSAILTSGVRCLSDFAREAVLRYAESERAGSETVQPEIADLGRRVSDLERSVEEIRSAIAMADVRASGVSV